MAALSLCIVLCVLLVAAAFGPVPRIKWEHKDVHLTHFHMDGIFNYSTLLLSEDEDVLYIGAREVVFAVNSLRIAEKMQEVYWKVTEEKSNECARKGKSRQTECLNYIRVLQPSSDKALYVCGTNAFQPTCDLLELSSFQFMGKNEDGKGRCPFDPAQSYTSVMVDGELYSATSYTFLGSEPIIFKHSQQSQLRTEYAVPWLNEPSFVYADVIRAPQNNPDGEDDKVYFFFTEVSVEFDFLSKLLIPRIARVCKGDQGGLRTLQKKWTTFLKAKLICHSPENNFIFNVINDVFILKSPNLREQVIYGVFTSHLNNVGLSAVCAYNVSTVEDVFAKGKYMQSATVEQSHTKWVRFNGEVPKPRPGACINNEARAMNYTSSLNLPDKTLQFVKDHPLIDDSVTPMGNKPKLVLQNVVLTQIVVDRVTALDGSIYDVMFLSTDNGMLHKAVNQDSEMRIIEEIVLFPNHEPVQTLLLSSKQDKHYIYAGSNVGVVQSPVAFCEKFTTCAECVLTRDPYCAWHPLKSSCVNILQENNTDRVLIQMLNGDISQCPASSPIPFPPPATSSLSSVGPGFHPSLSSMPPEVLSRAEPEPVTLLPPFLSDQGHFVNVHGTLHLFCHATGPEDLHFTWEKDGIQMESCVQEAVHTMADGNVHILSWVRDVATRDAEYQCTVKSKSVLKSSKVFIRVTDGVSQGWSSELSRWKSAINEHNSVMEGWKKSWESCKKKDVN
ncbi:semaphorin-4D isoform X3 [Spea bombifrons]|uniref:semaphorin-4D isoform X3 n=1 Tax=Spea bombifrons TaxID=233779 RepID=UPI00234B4F80|nr:semaphorin-4D isoform X3 [Spea bombifrons]